MADMNNETIIYFIVSESQTWIGWMDSVKGYSVPVDGRPKAH